MRRRLLQCAAASDVNTDNEPVNELTCTYNVTTTSSNTQLISTLNAGTVLEYDYPEWDISQLKTMYIDDLCVDKDFQGKHIGTELYNYAKIMAKSNGCYDITLNVWNLNPTAFKFYEKLGMVPRKVMMEEIL